MTSLVFILGFTWLQRCELKSYFKNQLDIKHVKMLTRLFLVVSRETCTL